MNPNLEENAKLNYGLSRDSDKRVKIPGLLLREATAELLTTEAQ